MPVRKPAAVTHEADPLDRYNAKRDFAKTAEPRGELGEAGSHLFMVQKHDATRLHWDFRLELGGVLKSWAVTRGPSLDPDDKRLAVRTEDHPLGYATFEGTIPKGEYGGGTVMLWDRGRWTPHPGKDPAKTLEEGHLHFTLAGERMKGEWILIRLKPRGREKTENWLLRKVEDGFSGHGDTLVETALTSVATGRTMAEIAAGKAASEQQPVPRRRPRSSGDGSKLDSGLRRGRAKRKASAEPPAFRDVQLATLVDHVPAGPGWLHEVKYDGYRCLIAVGGGTARAFTRSGQDWSDRFAPVVEAAAALPGSALIDGEIAALDGEGRPDFGRLQATLKDGSAPLAFFAFDLLEQDGEDLTGLPNLERKARLKALLDGVGEPIHYAEHVAGEGETLFSTLCAGGYEGVVSKRADASYHGRRTSAWLKVKCIRRQEFVLIGWSESQAKGRAFGSLLLGVNGEEGLRYAGRVGTGFDAATIASLGERLAALERGTPPVAVPRPAARGAHWVEPVLVAEVAFAEETADGVLRHASFLGLRGDKPAAEVRQERARPAPVERPGGDLFGVRLTHGERMIFPEARITKEELARYYAAMASPILRWAGDRPISLVRCPQGRGKHCFFQKHDSGSFGDVVRHVPIPEKDGATADYLYIDSGAGLVACVQMGTIEFHGWGSRIDPLEKPDRLVFDLDPDEGLAFADVKTAAVELKALLADIGLASFPMLSGGKGIHVVVPLTPFAEWPAVKDFASRFSKALGQARPEMFTANMKKVERRGRIFLDWLRNQRGATAVMPWCARARPNGPVATPVGWEELPGIDTAARWTVRDRDELIARAADERLAGWGRAEQRLPDV